MQIASVAQVRRMEEMADGAGIGETLLQERAGSAVASVVAGMLARGESVCVLAGKGNNGRDGAIAARRLAEAGVSVDLCLVTGHAVRGDEVDSLAGLGVRVASTEPAVVEEALARCGVAVDALLGIGTRGAPRGGVEDLVRCLNGAATRRSAVLRVVALDVPTGIDADSGEVPGEAVRADVTVTLGAVKQGLLRFPAAHGVGEIVAVDIGLPSADELPAHVLDEERLRGCLPARRLDAHKYTFGRVLVVAGSDVFRGAAALCARAATRAGAGLVTVASTPAVKQLVAIQAPEVVFADTDMDFNRDGVLEVLAPLIEGADAVVVGPGVGRGETAVRFLRDLLRLRARVAPRHARAVLDADALFALSEWDGWWREVGANVVITPHAGELARLTGGPRGEESDEPGWLVARNLASEWGCTLVAKGPFTAVAAPGGQVDVWPRANAALATAGTGDVLAGLCGGLLAQGVPPWDAARMAVLVHARAAVAVLNQTGRRTLVAGDLLDELPVQLAKLDHARRDD